MKTNKNLAIIVFALLLSVASFAQKTQRKANVTTVNPKFDATKSIIDNLSASQNYSSLAKVFKAAEFEQILREEGPFTILAPSNDAINRSSENLDFMTDPKNIHRTKDIAAYYMIRGQWYATDFGKLIRMSKGRGEIKTADGDILVFTLENSQIYVTDAKGNKAKLVFTDAIQSNGIIHGIDKTFSPN
ncbi:fasciclin domain-containing protein [Flavobacterium microcysteis]